MPKSISINFSVGDKSDRWEIIGSSIRLKGIRYYPCRCECSTERLIRASNLSSHSTQSCGCLSKEVTTARNFKHGAVTRGARDPLYGVFASMIARCENPNVESYVHYGDRGISVCSQWRYDFSQFKIWALETGYSEGMTIERKDNNGNYCPENCVWIPFELQARNKRSNHYLVLFGQRKLMIDWFKDSRCVVDKTTFYRRVHDGLSEEQALTMPSLRPWLKRKSHREDI